MAEADQKQDALAQFICDALSELRRSQHLEQDGQDKFVLARKEIAFLKAAVVMFKVNLLRTEPKTNMIQMLTALLQNVDLSLNNIEHGIPINALSGPLSATVVEEARTFLGQLPVQQQPQPPTTSFSLRSVPFGFTHNPTPSGFSTGFGFSSPS